MKRSRLLVAASLALLIAAVLATGIWLGRHGPLKRSPQAAASGSVETSASPGTVTVSRDAQERSGIAMQTPQPMTLHPSASGYATVVDLQALIGLSKRIVTGEADVRSAEVAASTSRQELERSRALYADDRNVSHKTVQQAEVVYRADEARLESAQANLREARADASQQYGATLAAWAAQPSSGELNALASRKRVLVSVVLPNMVSGNPPRTVRLGAAGYEQATAKLVSPSPRSDPISAGSTYLYLSDIAYPAGLALDAQVPLGGAAIDGFVVPESAVIWYGNETWVFVQQSPERFVRRALREPRSTARGIFTTTAFKPGEGIVTTGAELLQSEVLRPKTPAASGCADPECD